MKVDDLQVMCVDRRNGYAEYLRVMYFTYWWSRYDI